MPNFKTLLPLLVTGTLLLGCKNGFNKEYDAPNTNNDGTAPPCSPTAVDSGANDYAKQVLKLVATFSCESKTDKKRVLSGQFLGTVDDVVHNNAYQNLVKTFANNSATPAVLALDYAKTADFSTELRQAANNYLADHWSQTGLVSISWMPANPWRSVKTDYTLDYTSGHSLSDLTTNASGTNDYEDWHKQLDALADALLDLQNRNVAVLWSPLPGANDSRYWWGTQASTGSDGENAYSNLWKDMFTYLQNKGVHNLVWVFAPVDTATSTANKPIDWGFTNIKSYVDVVAPIARNSDLSLRDYQDMISTGKPLGMTELSNNLASLSNDTKGTFDNWKYKTKLIDTYPYVAYWISGDDETSVASQYFRSLAKNSNGLELLQDDAIFTAEKIANNNLRQ